MQSPVEYTTRRARETKRDRRRVKGRPKHGQGNKRKKKNEERGKFLKMDVHRGEGWLWLWGTEID